MSLLSFQSLWPDQQSLLCAHPWADLHDMPVWLLGVLGDLQVDRVHACRFQICSQRPNSLHRHVPLHRECWKPKALHRTGVCFVHCRFKKTKKRNQRQFVFDSFPLLHISSCFDFWKPLVSFLFFMQCNHLKAMRFLLLLLLFFTVHSNYLAGVCAKRFFTFFSLLHKNMALFGAQLTGFWLSCSNYSHVNRRKDETIFQLPSIWGTFKALQTGTAYMWSKSREPPDISSWNQIL